MSSARIFTLCSVLVMLAWSGVASSQPAEPPVQQAPLTLSDLVWIDRSTGVLSSDLSQVAIAPGNPQQLYIAGRGFIARSSDGGISWGPSLLLFRGELVSNQTSAVEVTPEDEELFDDSELQSEFEELREETFEELAEQYGEDFAGELILEIEDELRQDVVTRLTDEAEQELADRIADERAKRLEEAGFQQAEADELANRTLDVYQLTTVSGAPRSLYAATGSGLFRTIDSGLRWERILNIGADGSGVVFNVAVLEQGRIVLAGTDEGLKISDNAGRTFKPAAGQVHNEAIHLVKSTPAEDYVFAAGRRKFYRTDDNGETWTSFTPLGFNPDEIRDLAIDAGDPDIVVAATTNGLFISTNAGESWSPLASTGVDRTLRQVLMPTGDAGTIIALGTDGIVFTTNGGNSWQPLQNGLSAQELAWLASEGSELWLATESGAAQAVSSNDFSLQAETLRLLQAQWQEEPSPAEVLNAALIYAGLDIFPEENWYIRHKLSMFGPRVDTRFVLIHQRNEVNYATFQLDLNNPEPNLANLSRERRQVEVRDPRFEFRIMAYWDFGQLLHDSTEISLESRINRRRAARRKLSKKIIKSVLKRRMLQFRLASSVNLDLQEEIEVRLQIEEITALLDGFTGGFYTASYNR